MGSYLELAPVPADEPYTAVESAVADAVAGSGNWACLYPFRPSSFLVPCPAVLAEAAAAVVEVDLAAPARKQLQESLAASQEVESQTAFHLAAGPLQSH